MIRTEPVAKGEMRANIAELQERIDSSILPISESTNYYPTEERISEARLAQEEIKAREREMVRKGIDMLERQILQYVNVYVSKDVVDTALNKKCKTTDIPALNVANGNIQKALQRNVGFNGMDPDAQARCHDIEELYNKAEVHSINTSKGDAADVGVFSETPRLLCLSFWNLHS